MNSLKNVLGYLNPWSNSHSRNKFRTIAISKPTKHLILFPGGYYICGTRSWSARDLNWIYYFPGQETGYLVSGQPIKKNGLEIYHDFCPGLIWQMNPKIMINAEARCITGPIIISKIESKDEKVEKNDDNTWSRDEVIGLV